MYKNKISAVYQIINTVTGDRYVGSSKDVMRRWIAHKSPSTWKEHLNSPMYKDFQKYGLDKFRFQILAPVEPEHLKQVEQEFIEMIQPKYNKCRADGLDVERYKEWYQSEKGKESCRKSHRRWSQSEKGKEYWKEYYNQLCLYKDETLTLAALRNRFSRAGIKHPNIEAKKYLIRSR